MVKGTGGQPGKVACEGPGATAIRGMAVRRSGVRGGTPANTPCGHHGRAFTGNNPAACGRTLGYDGNRGGGDSRGNIGNATIIDTAERETVCLFVGCCVA